jgi:hypothetical protein
MNDTERAFLVRDMAARVLREHASGRSVAPDRLDWAIGVAIETMEHRSTTQADPIPRARISTEA